MLIPPAKRKHSRIPLISLIDMTFMLFIFFILITRFSNLDQVELNVGDVAKKSGGGAVLSGAKAPAIVYLRLGANAVRFGEMQIAYKDIGAAVKPYLPGYAVVIEAGEGSSVQQMVSVLDAVKLAGATEITLKEAP